MFGEINRRFNKAKKNAEENRFIIESTLEVEEVLPGSEDEFDDEIDVDSVPEDVYKEIDKKLDELISKGDYDDEEIEEMVDEDDDFDDDDFDIKVEEVVNEAIDHWVMNEENSYGSGEKVDVQNKTDDEKDGDHTETEIPEPDCPVKAEKEVEKGEELYDFSDDNKKPSDYKEGDQVKTEEADFETTEEAKKAMSATNESAISMLRAMLTEDASYGSGKSVEVENKTNDAVDGDKTKVEEPDFETAADAKKDLDKGEDEFDKVREGKEESEANLGMKEGDHAEMETKNPITNEDVTMDEDFDFDFGFNESVSPVGTLRAIMNEEVSLDEGAVIQKWATFFSSDFKNLKKEIKAAEKAKRAEDKQGVKDHKAAAKKLLASVEKKAKDIPDDNWLSWGGRIAISIAATAAAFGPGVDAGAKLIRKGHSATGMAVSGGGGFVAGSAIGGVLGDFLNAKDTGRSLKEVSKNQVLDALKQMKERIDKI